MLRWHDNKPVDRGDKEVESRPLIFLFWYIYESISLTSPVSSKVSAMKFSREISVIFNTVDVSEI